MLHCVKWVLWSISLALIYMISSSTNPVAAVRAEIDVLNFGSAAEYLRAVIDEKARSGKSLRSFTQWSGLKSPATLSLVMRGKRSISEEVEDKLMRYLKLVGNRKRYLKALSALTRAKDSEGRMALKEELFYIKHLAQAKHLEVKQYEFIARWYYSVIYVLVGLPHFRRDPSWLSQRLGRYISAKNIEDAIGNMLDLELLKDENGTLVQTSGTVLKTGDEVRHLSVRQYHRRMIELSARALELPQEIREITGLTVGLPLNKLDEVKQLIRQFRENIDALLDKHQSEANEVYQLNIQFFPLTFPVVKGTDA